jgi:hypothetical protein
LTVNRLNSTQKDFDNKLIILAIFVLIFSGVFVSLFKLSGVTLPINIVSVAIMILSAISILKAFSYKINTYFIYILGLFIFSILFKLTIHSPLLEWRSIPLMFFYILPIFSFFLFSGANSSISKLIRQLSFLGFLILAISYIQLVFFAVLPIELVELPNFNIETINNDYTREYKSELLFRPNGLFGSPIVLGTFLLLIFNIDLYLFNDKKSLFGLIKLILNIFMLIILASRTNIAASLIIFLIFIYQSKGLIALIKTVAVSVIISVSFVYIYQNNFEYTALDLAIDRFLLIDEWAVASNQEHFNDYNMAWNYWNEKYILGAPIGDSSGMYSIITDGFWFSILFEFGTIGFLLFIALYGAGLRYVYKISVNNRYLGIFFPFFVVFIFAGLFNSAGLHKTIYMLIWVVFGLSYSLYKNTKTT